MRLYEDQINVLKNKLHSISSTAQLYLFGSRVDDTKKGGDIDLLIVSNEITKKDLRILRIEFFKHFGECTNCARCIEVCDDDALNFSITNFLRRDK